MADTPLPWPEVAAEPIAVAARRAPADLVTPFERADRFLPA